MRKRVHELRAKDSSNDDKMNRIVEFILSLGEEKFTGYVKLNFSQGAIGRVERFEEVLKKIYP